MSMKFAFRQEADLEEKQKLVEQTCEEREKAANTELMSCVSKDCAFARYIIDNMPVIICKVFKVTAN